MAWNKKTKPVPDYVKKKISKTLSGRTWRKKIICPICGNDNVRTGRKFCSRECFGISERGKESPMKDKKFNGKALENIRKAAKKRIGRKAWNKGIPNFSGRGKNCHLWKGGTTKLSIKIRSSFEYREWRRKIFERDNYICRICEKRGGDVHADHIKPFYKIILQYNVKNLQDAQNCNQLWDIYNGRTLCVECHKKTKTYPKNLR